MNKESFLKSKTEIFLLPCFFVAFLIVSGIVSVWDFDAFLKENALKAGTDTWLRLTIVKDLWVHGDWYNHQIENITSSEGIFRSWTRPLDVLLLLTAAPVSIFTGIEKALLVSAVLMGPLCLLVIIIICMKWYQKQFPALPAGMVVFFFLLFFNKVTLTYFWPLNADHHALLTLLYTLLLFEVAKIGSPDMRGRGCIIIGSLMGLGVWVSIEFFMPVFTLFAWLAILWMKGVIPARKISVVALAMVGTAAIAIAVEYRMSEWAEENYDTLSLPYLFLTILNALTWCLLLKVQSFAKTPKRRMISLIIAATVNLGLIILLFPKVFYGPFADLAPFVKDVFLPGIKEMRPYYERIGYGLTAIWIITAVAGAGYLVKQFRSRQDEDARHYMLIVMAAIIFLLLSIFSMRWMYYALPPLILIYSHLVAESTKNLKLFWKGSLLGLSVLIPLLMPTIEQLLVQQFSGKQNSVTSSQAGLECNNQLLQYIYKLSHDRPHLNVLSPQGMAGQILFLTDFRVLSGNYHRAAEGMKASYDFMHAGSDEAAHKIISKYQIDLVALCAGGGKNAPFTRRLLHEQPPFWLEGVKMKDKPKQMLLFKVVD